MKKLLKTKDDEICELQAQVAQLEAANRELEHQLDIYRSIPVPGSPRMGPRKERGVGISAEPHALKTATETNLRKYPKSEKTKDLINRAIQDNEFMKKLDPSQIREIVDCMYPVDHKTDSVIIQEGSDGSLVYAIEDGTVEISKQGRKLSTLSSGKIFGELAILYHCVRTASVKATTACKLWVIERQAFQMITMSVAVRKNKQYLDFLSSVPAFKTLTIDTLKRIVDALDEIHYENGEYIIRQNQPGDTFYIISKGKVKVTQESKNSVEPTFLRDLAAGSFFGERALETEDVRSANIIANDPTGVTCLVLEREAYKTLISKSLFHDQHWEDVNRKKTDDMSGLNKEFAKVSLSDIKFIATLGIGGFGRVELVQIGYDTKRSFALKKLKKQHIVATRQQQHMMNEKKILMDTNSDFIIKLYRTFRDKKYLYMLTEVALGGELWSLLRDKGSFDTSATRFYSACVTEAFGHLHSRGIIYRDLKPENLVLDANGYVKLIDFGFAKEIGISGKTFTFCGTPEYVAPEVILNKGHGLAVDLWSLGILIYELQTGSAPFAGSDHMKTYNLILKGIEAVDFPKFFNKNAQKLIKQLCRENPAERLGCDNGIKMIQKHKWFEGFNWDGLRKRSLKAPYVPKVKNAADSSNFDDYPSDEKVPADDESGWDKDF